MDDFPFIRTKLHRPRSPENFIHRVRLTEQLQSYSSHSSILVSAPAGYGKSTLVSCWLEEYGRLSGWLSIDANDNDLHTFLIYLLEAIRGIFPDALPKSTAMLKGKRLPELKKITHHFINEIDIITDDFVLVLDDIHTITNKAIHEFLGGLLQHPPRPLLLVLIGRRDPPLSIPVLRARNQLGEIRIQHLRFTEAETLNYFQQSLDRSINRDLASVWMDKMEGWITGLHLVAIYLLQGADLGILPKFQKGTHHILEYLLHEVLFHQPDTVRNRLMESSILNRFCTSLCETVCTTEVDIEKQHESGAEFVQLLKKEDLFVISLDEEGNWYRYHHLFQQLLHNQLKERYKPEQIAELHRRATSWYESRGLIDEAIDHAMKSGEVERAIEIIDQYRHEKHIAGQWYLVEKWLSWIPRDVRKNNASMLLAQAWVDFVCFRLERIPAIVEQLEELLVDNTPNPQLLSELNFFKGNQFYWEGAPESSIDYLEKSRIHATDSDTHLRSNIDFILGLSYHMNGEKTQALNRLTAQIKAADSADHYYRSYLFGGLSFLHLLSGEMVQSELNARQVEIIAGKCNAQNSVAWGYYLQGYVNLQKYNISQAIRNFSDALDQRYVFDPQAVIDSLVGQALAYHFGRQPDKVKEKITELIIYAEETEDPYMLFLAQSGAARIAILTGDLATATQWIRGIEESPLHPAALFTWLEVPYITHARVLIAIDSQQSLEQANTLLRDIWQITDKHHFTGQKIETGILQCMVAKKQGRTQDGVKILENIFTLVEPGQWIRPFIEAGTPISETLTSMKDTNRHAAEVLATLTGTDPTYQTTSLQAAQPDKSKGLESKVLPEKIILSDFSLDLLTNREHDILELLEQRLQNKEIALKLGISPQTVGYHLKNIYRKLGVNNRQKAVRAAKGL